MAIAGVPTAVLVAPDAFKGTLRATDVAAAIGRGLERAGLQTDICPIADGGEGTLDALADAVGAEIYTASVQDPLGRPIEARFGLTPSSRRGATAVVEAAAASGLHLVAGGERDPLRASTFCTTSLVRVTEAASGSCTFTSK